MWRPQTRRILVAVGALLVLGFLLPPFLSVNRFKARIVGSMSRALGRDVSVGEVHLRLLPQPGFDLRNLVIGEDPAFGAEPMLRADKVTASFRLASLWRGRLEVASLSLKSGADINPASLNLVRAPDGRWNVEALLQRSSQTPTAPTEQKHAEARPRFPYIEADGGRINFKFGPEKKVYALSDADFGLWLASEDEWAFRLAATPMRTDTNLTDTGRLKVSGRFRRATELRQTPLQVSLSLQGAQLGQITKLIYGRDRGWRGAVAMTATLAGTPGGLNITARASLQDFRRYDIGTVETLQLEARCTAQYSTATDHISRLDCRLPLGDGVVMARGEIEQPIAPRAYDLSIVAEQVPAQVLIMLGRHAKKDIPDDLNASGAVEAAFSVRRSAGQAQPQWIGNGRASDIVLRSAVLGPEMPVGSLGFALEGLGTAQYGPPWANQRSPQPPMPPGLRLAIAPFHLPLGEATPADASGWFAADNYHLAVHGDARLPRLLRAGRALGLRAPQYNADGAAKLDLQVRGSWSGFNAPVVVGSAQLRNVSARMNGIAAPLQIAAANLVLMPDAALAQNITANVGKTLQFGGWVRVARGCDTLENCPIEFAVQADQISVDDLNRLFNPALAKRPWYDILPGRSQPSLLARVQARGHVGANRLVVRAITAGRVTADASFDGGKIELTNLRADVLGGKHRGTWRADFTGVVPAYSGAGTVEGVPVAQLAALMHDNWATGTLAGRYHLSVSGWSASDLVSSAEGGADFDWRNGVLRHVSLDGQNGPLQFKEFSGSIELREGSLTLLQSKMAAAGGIYQVSGTASLGRQLGLKLRNGGRAYSISGPLEKPKVAAVAGETQAALQR